MYILVPTARRIVPGFLKLCLVEIVPFAFPARAVHVQSTMHGVHTWPKVLVWTPETLRASQSERDTSVPCCLNLTEDSNALTSLGGVGVVGGGEGTAVAAVRAGRCGCCGGCSRGRNGGGGVEGQWEGRWGRREWRCAQVG